MPNRFLIAAAWLAFFLVRFGFAADAADWRAWRGPLGNGSVEQGNYPVEFDADNNLWRTQLPGKGCSTPIWIKGIIYLTSPAEGSDALLCYDFDGSEKWRAVFGKENAGKHRNGSGSNASPATDGSAVFVFFKSGTFAAVELDGKVRWKTDLVERFGKDTLFWDHGTSPVLTDKYVIMARMHQGESWLAAFNKLTGELAWKVARNYPTPTECDHGYTTPLVIQHQGKESILVWGAEHLTIHNATDGQVTWSCGNFNPEANKLWPAIVTPVIVGDMAVIAYGRNDRGIPRLHGIRLTGSGDVTQTNHVWKREDVGAFVPTPAVYKGRVVLVGDHGEVTSIDPATGDTIWKGAFPKNRANYYASPLIAGGLLYAPREDGVVFVANVANDKFELLSENNMAESVIGSPVPASNRILIRGEQHLFCMTSEKSALHAPTDGNDGWVPIFDGATLAGWKANEHPESWSVKEGAIVGHGERSHLYYEKEQLEDFELKTEVMINKGGNSGVYFHIARHDEGWFFDGHEVQINNSHTDPVRTGSLWAVVKLYESNAKDDEWFPLHIAVKGKNIVVRVNGKIVVDYTEPKGTTDARRIGRGFLALQAHDPGSVVKFRNILLKTP